MKIYVYITSTWQGGDVLAEALAEDGHGLGSHLSSNRSWAKHDMGLTSDWHHDVYRRHCPDGYELEWVDDPANHAGVAAAIAKNRALFAAKGALPGVGG